MSDIFISYARQDETRAEMLAKTLKGRGWSIFWDRTIPTGKTWRETIGRELEGACCVIVLWSKTSIESGWVQDEADAAKQRGVLVPILIENVQPPIGFRMIQAAHLENWDGTESTEPLRRLIADIAALIRPPPNQAEKEPPSTTLSPQAPQSVTPELRERLEHVTGEQPEAVAATSTVPLPENAVDIGDDVALRFISVTAFTLACILLLWSQGDKIGSLAFIVLSLVNGTGALIWRKKPWMRDKFILTSSVGVLASLLALWWVQPNTAGGQGLLVIIVFGLVNGIGALIWRKKQ